MRLLAILLLPACEPLGPWTLPDSGDSDPEGARVVVSPALLDFGTVSVNGQGTQTATLTLYNLGEVSETVTGHDEPLGCDDFTVAAEPVLDLEGGAELDLTVTYRPETDGDCTAELLVAPAGEVVRLVGVATAPVLVAEEPSFEPVVLGCTGGGQVRLTNAGSEPLVVESAWVASEEFAVGTLPGTLAPGTTGVLEVSFTPAGGGNRGTTLLVRSDDPAHPETSVLLTGLGYEGERVTESFRYRPSNPTDVLFVVDTEGVFAARISQADDAAGAYVDALRDTNVDYQLAALSGDAACPSSTPYATRSDTSLAAERVLEHGFHDASGAWDEDLLGLALAALDETGVGGCLEGFRREEADLQLVVVTDGPSDADVAAQADAVEALFAEDVDLLVSGLLPLSDCGVPAEDYAAVAETRGGVVEDLCAADWTDAFLAFASLPETEDAVRYVLAEAPVASTIAVRVEGATWSAWSWDTAGQAVVFDADTRPALGAEVEVEYVSAVACQAR